jgi:hypothetical protein
MRVGDICCLSSGKSGARSTLREGGTPVIICTVLYGVEDPCRTPASIELFKKSSLSVRTVLQSQFSVGWASHERAWQRPDPGATVCRV